MEYTKEIFLEQYHATKEYQRQRGTVNKGVALPADISEMIVCLILRRRGDKRCRPARKGDLVSDTEGVIQVKCFTSNGPTSFGARTYWDVLYFLDAREWMEDDRFRLYRIGVGSRDDRWLDLRFTESKTFGQMIRREDDDDGIPVRPRCSFERLQSQLGDLCEMIFHGTIHDILRDEDVPDMSLIDDGILRVVDLFAGTGAFSLAFRENGCAVVFANDMMESSKRIYEHNLGHDLMLGDLNDIPIETIPSHDILTGGFPCQPFSIAGARLGFEDRRANVFFRLVEIIRYHRPQCILLENVKNIIQHDPFPPDENETSDVLRRSSHIAKRFGRTITTITRLLEEEGYFLHLSILNTSKVTGIPQHRERMYLVGFRDRRCFDSYDAVFDIVEKRPVSEFLDRDVPSQYYYTQDRYKKEIIDSVEAIVARDDTLYQYRRTMVRENKSMECPTLTANMGGGGHNVPLLRDTHGVRKLTPRECFRLQGFPESYRLSKALCDGAHYRLAGNAVSYPIVLSIANRIVQSLKVYHNVDQ
jgi:DNA (cytosine-5)-methyltransferase 1